MKELNTIYLRVDLNEVSLMRGFTHNDEVIRVMTALEIAMDLSDEGFDINMVEWKEPSRFEEWFTFEELTQIIESIPHFHDGYQEILEPLLVRFKVLKESA